MARLELDDIAVQRARRLARERHANAFQWDDVLAAYTGLLVGKLPARSAQVAAE